MKLEDICQIRYSLAPEEWGTELTASVQSHLANIGLYTENTIEGKIDSETIKALQVYKVRNGLGSSATLEASTAILLLQNSQTAKYAINEAVRCIRRGTALRLKSYLISSSPFYRYAIGFGSLSDLSNRSWKKNDSVTLHQAEELLRRDLLKGALPLCYQIPNWSRLEYYQQAALLCFAHELKTPFYNSPGFEELSRALCEEQLEEIPRILCTLLEGTQDCTLSECRRRRLEINLWKGELS